jgi:hypothetical protein
MARNFADGYGSKEATVLHENTIEVVVSIPVPDMSDNTRLCLRDAAISNVAIKSV